MSQLVDDGLRSCRRSALHLEMRDGYILDDPEFIAWQGGHRYDPANREAWWNPWLAIMAEATGRGVRARRARIVSEPVSAYIQYEYDITFANVEAGEDVRWLARRRATDIAVPGNDFWLFDDEVLLINHFSGNGDWIGVEPIDNPDLVGFCASAFESVWERGIPHVDYRPIMA